MSLKRLNDVLEVLMKFTFLFKYMYNKKNILFKHNYIQDYNKYYPVHDRFRLVDNNAG